MTRIEQEIRRRLLKKIRAHLRQESDKARAAYLLGLEAGELLHGKGTEDREALQANFTEAKKARSPNRPYERKPIVTAKAARA